ncbi:MAG: hypothetical protein JXR12_06615 [Neptunomonas phycophila]|uniref:hypothetical protein n=1 Tax=Neptunomonas phycophila TaxID=1572645 RepID=UPI003B8BFF7B
MHSTLNITKLVHAIAESNVGYKIQQLFKAGGEINEDPHDIFKLITPPNGLEIYPHAKDATLYNVFIGLRWINDEEDGQLEIADIVLTYDTTINELTSAGCCGMSYVESEWFKNNKD